MSSRDGERLRLLESVVIHTKDAVLITEAEPVGLPGPRIVYCNAAFTEATGYTEAEVLGKTPRLLQGVDTDPKACAKIRAALDQWKPIEIELLNYRKDGTPFWVEISIVPVADDRGWYTHWVSIQRDITDRKKAAQDAETRARIAEDGNQALRTLANDLELSLEAAEAANVAKGEFLANMSHEIRTPLTGLLGFAGLLEALPDLPEKARSYARRIAASGETLLAVVNDILDFSKLEADRVDLDPHAFDPAVLLAESVELVAVQVLQKGLTLTTEIVGPLPEAVLADGARVRQVLLNLISNAIKFTEAGQIRVTLRYQPEAGGALRFAVNDSGIGIPAGRFDRLFQRFSQVDSSNTRQYGGTGLGLAISKTLTELMGGQIGAESLSGQGSTFWFTIAAPPAALMQPEPVPSAPLVTASTTRLLVVDDVAMNRELVRIMLSPFGYEITEATGGAEAVKLAMTGRFDLILMDLQMPGMDGLAATRAIRATCEPNRLTPIVALSANVLPRHLSECAEAGMDDHIAKPINPTELLTKIAQWAGGPGDDQAVLSG